MSEITTEKGTLPRRSRLVAALLFIFCAIPGLALSIYSLAQIISRFVDLHPKVPHPLISSATAILGLLMMLAGVGKWKKWRYLLVFLAFPVSFFGYLFVEPRLIRGGPEAVTFEVAGLIMFTGISTFLTYYAVRRYYRRLESSSKNR
jgi:uncharacterized membrane protein